MNIQIEKGIPIPKQGEKSSSKFPFDKMDLGDCFFVPVRYGDTVGYLQQNLSQAGRYYNRVIKGGCIFKTYKEYNGVRVWRIK